MSIVRRLPIVAPAAGAITFGLFVGMKELIWVEAAPLPPKPEPVAFSIDEYVEPIDDPRLRDFIEIDTPPPPPPPDGLPEERATPDGDFIEIGGLPEIGPVDPPQGMSPINLDQLARPIVRREPVYDQRLIERNVQGMCIVRFDVTPEGRTANIQVTDCDHDGFARASIRAVAQWRYDPAMTDGEVRWMRGLSTRFDFQLDA